jgi:tyrosyl-tRNA synthetase
MMTILEGLDGVQKMSKSLGNAVGIKEPPLEMYGKLMSISDDLMWRYYTLLTDVRADQIEDLKTDAKSGSLHPMQAKKDLARRIVADFHSEQDAGEAAENWAKQFQKHETPDDLSKLTLKLSDIGGSPDGAGAHSVRVDKLLAKAGLADSASDGQRKIKQHAVKIDGELCADASLNVKIPQEFVVRVGRQMKRIRIEL